MSEKNEQPQSAEQPQWLGVDPAGPGEDQSVGFTPEQSEEFARMKHRIGETLRSKGGVVQLTGHPVQATKVAPTCPLRPRDNWVILERHKLPDRTPGGLIRPDAQQTPINTGTVLAVGPGRYEHGTFVPVLGIELGDVVHFADAGCTDVEVAGVVYGVLPAQNCFAVLAKTAAETAPKAAEVEALLKNFKAEGRRVVGG